MPKAAWQAAGPVLRHVSASWELVLGHAVQLRQGDSS